MNQFYRYLGKLVLCSVLLLLVSCGSQQQSENNSSDSGELPTPAPRETEITNPTISPDPTEPFPVEPNPAQNENLANATGQLEHEWTINTGDINEIVVAEDGKIYGLIHRADPTRHVALTSEGEIEKVTELPDDDRFGWGNLGVASRDDGTLLFTETYDPDQNPVTSGHNILIVELFPDGRMQIWDLPTLPADCTSIVRLTYFGSNTVLARTKTGGGPYCYYHIDDTGLVLDSVVTVPSDHNLQKLGPSLIGSGHAVVSYEDQSTGDIVHVNTDGVIVYRGKPDGLDVERNYDDYETPWGDLWLSYNEYDEIGVDKGQKILRIDADGNQTFYDSFLPESYPEHSTGSRKTYYLRDKDEIYHVEKDRLLELDRDYNVLEEHAFPPDAKRNPWTFVGYDGNLYIWDPHDTRTLDKYVRVP